MRLIFIVFIIGFLNNCFLFKKDVVLNEDMLKKYIAAQGQINYLGSSGVGEFQQASPKKGNTKIDRIIKGVGFKDLDEFMRVSEKVSKVYSLIQRDSYIDDQEKISNSDELKSSLKNIETPKETKKGEKKPKEKDQLDPITASILKEVDKQSLDLVIKYKKQLDMVYKQKE